MLHAGVLMKLGAYGVVRIGMGLLPDGALGLAWLVGTIGCVNVVYGALSAMAQVDLKYVIAYSSVSHMGLVMPGAATAFTVGGLSSLGLPATSGFVAEVLTFMGAWRSEHPWWLFPAVVGTFLTAI